MCKSFTSLTSMFPCCLICLSLFCHAFLDQGPWSEADAAAVADAVGTVPAPATDNNNLGDLDAFGAGYRVRIRKVKLK
jgi:hypothetical protein